MRMPVALGTVLVTAIGLLAPSGWAVARPGSEPAYALKPTPCPMPTMKAWECSTLDVPMDWFDRSDPRRAEIAVAVRPATGERRGALTINPGGPGSPSIWVADQVLGSLPATVKRHFDLVLWDPRGVGLSRPTPTGCTAPNAIPEIPATGPVDWSAIAQDYVASRAEANRQCYDANPDVAPYLGTEYVVRDLEALRKTLGVHRWDYWGMSYGTQVGLLYAKRYPSRLRATLLDGAVQPGLTISSAAASRGTAYQMAFALLGASIGPVHAMRMGRVIRALNTRTYMTSDGREMTRTEFLQVMVDAAGSQEFIPVAVATIDEGWRALFGGDRSGRASRPQATAFGATYTRNFILCGDTVDRPSIAEAGAAAQASAETGTVYAGILSLVWSGTCAGLPPGAHRVPRVTKPLTLPHPPVVLNALGDPATPWVWASDMASVFRGASFITYDGVGHVVYGNTPSRCVNDAVTAYLMRLTRPGDITCAYVPG